MSHYMCGMDVKEYKIDNDCGAIAELRYNMSNRYAYLPYAALKAMDYCNGVSGNGEVVEYSKADIENAIAEIDRVRCFLNNMLKANRKKYVIGWW